MRILRLSFFMAAFASLSAFAAPPSAYEALDRASAAACIRASGLRDAAVGPATRFSDTFLMDVRTVTGTWPQPHMKGAKASMLCLYNRKTRQAETQEKVTSTSTAPMARQSGQPARLGRS